MGHKVIELLGIGTSATHMEWFIGPKGLKFSEIGCRPPGVRAWDLYNVANDMDIYREWAMAIVGTGARASGSRAGSPPASSRCAPIATATSPATTGSTQVRKAFGEHFIDWHTPRHGTPTQPVEAGLHGERLDAHEAPQLRPSAPHARRRRAHR